MDGEMHQKSEHELIELLDDGENLITYFCVDCNMVFTMNLQTGEETQSNIEMKESTNGTSTIC